MSNRAKNDHPASHADESPGTSFAELLRGCLGPASDAPARVADAALGERSHMCAFFGSAEEEYEVMLPFIIEGLQRGEKAYHTIDPDRADEHLRRLLNAKIDVDYYSQREQLELKTWDDVYLMNGKFEPEVTGAVYGEAQARAQKHGYRKTRFIGHMEWVTDHMDRVDDLLLMEARWNAAQAQMPPAHVVCMYDLKRYRADTMLDVMRTHPQIIVGKAVYENPFYVSPEEFIGELESRTERRRLKHA
jgi:hypothetical protein